MRGEHLLPLIWSTCGLGSSPHARGAHPPEYFDSAAVRIIPACAGSTTPSFQAFAQVGDHPRMRGEHIGTAISDAFAWGSSPHARGALARAHAAGAKTRIIPACAGSTSARRLAARLRGDHPRMRGEHFVFRKRPFDSQWIIPACAGSTFEGPYFVRSVLDHPRMRGEHTSRPARLVDILA